MNPLPGLKPGVSGLWHTCHDLWPCQTCRKRPPLRSERMPFIPGLESLGFSGIAYKLSQKEFAKAIEYSQAYVAEIEKDKREPSRDFLKKLNSVFGLSSDFILYGERKRPEKLEIYASEGLMPFKFIQRLKKDLENISNAEEFYSSLNIPREIIEEVLEGKLILNPESVIELSQKLGQPVYEYLLLAQYIPKELLRFTDYPEFVDLFKQISMLTPTEMKELLQTISLVIRPYVKKYSPED